MEVITKICILKAKFIRGILILKAESIYNFRLQMRNSQNSVYLLIVDSATHPVTISCMLELFPCGIRNKLVGIFDHVQKLDFGLQGVYIQKTACPRNIFLN